jgi:hypothetical protein
MSYLGLNKLIFLGSRVDFASIRKRLDTYSGFPYNARVLKSEVSPQGGNAPEYRALTM